MADRGLGARRLRWEWLASAGIFAAIATLGVAAAGAVAAGDHAIGGDRYEGSTSAGQATLIVVSASGRSITALLTAVTDDGRCGNRADEGYPYQILSDRVLKLAARGSFSLSTTGTTALHRSLPVIITGRFRGGEVTGMIAATGRQAHCAAPRYNTNPYVATFSATGAPAAAP